MENVLIKLVQEAKRNHKVECNALQDLHNEYGFDFCKPIKAIFFEDTFTKRTLEKDRGIDFDNDFVVVIFARYGWWEVVRYTGADVILPHRASFDTLIGLTRKGDFNDWRKIGFKTYVIAQDKKYIISPTFNEERRSRGCWKYNFDDSVRYELYDANRPYNGLIKRGQKHTYKNLYDYSFDLDKSGYVLDLKRDDLKRRAKELKTTRDKQAYNAMTNTRDMIAKVKTAIDLKKAEIAERLMNCDTSEDIRKVEDALNSWRGLGDAYYKYERAVSREKEKSFRSPEDFNETIGGLYTLLRKI